MLGVSINIPVYLSNTHGDQAVPVGHLTHSIFLAGATSYQCKWLSKGRCPFSPVSEPWYCFYLCLSLKSAFPSGEKLVLLLKRVEKPIISPPSTLNSASAMIYCNSWRMFCSILHRCSLIAWGRERDMESRLLPSLFSC